MRNVYPAFFTKTNDKVLVEVPDLDILTEGNDMNDAIDMARDAIELKCVFNIISYSIDMGFNYCLSSFF